VSSLIGEDRNLLSAVRLSDYFNRPTIIEKVYNFDHLSRGLTTQSQEEVDPFFTSEVIIRHLEMNHSKILMLYIQSLIIVVFIDYRLLVQSRPSIRSWLESYWRTKRPRPRSCILQRLQRILWSAKSTQIWRLFRLHRCWSEYLFLLYQPVLILFQLSVYNKLNLFSHFSELKNSLCSTITQTMLIFPSVVLWKLMYQIHWLDQHSCVFWLNNFTELKFLIDTSTN